MSNSAWCNIPVNVLWGSSGQYRNMVIWLLDNINHNDYDFGGITEGMPQHRTVYFGRKTDAILFALRWT